MRFARLTIVATSVVLLAGCASPAAEPDASAPPTPAPTAETSTPTPSPTAEAAALSTAGFAGITIGQPVPSDFSLATFDPDFCAEGSGAWVPETFTQSRTDFVIRTENATEDGVVTRVIVYSDEFATPSGITTGMTIDELTTAVPEAEGPGGIEGISELWVVSDGTNQLVFESFDTKTIDDIILISADEEPSGIASTDVGGVCTG